MSAGTPAPRTEEAPNPALVDYRLSELEKTYRAIHDDITTVRSQLAQLTALSKEQGSIREEVAKCRADHYQGDSKLWEALDSMRQVQQQTREDLITERGRIDALSRPLWLLFAAVIGQAGIVAWALLGS